MTHILLPCRVICNLDLMAALKESTVIFERPQRVEMIDTTRYITKHAQKFDIVSSITDSFLIDVSIELSKKERFSEE